MREWLAVLKAQGIQDGPIFRRIRRGGHLGEPLAAAAVLDIVRERCALAGVEGSFSAHSLRARFVTEAGLQNIPLPETMALTGHQSVATVVGYFRAESALGSKDACSTKVTLATHIDVRFDRESRTEICIVDS